MYSWRPVFFQINLSKLLSSHYLKRGKKLTQIIIDQSLWFHLLQYFLIDNIKWNFTFKN